MNTQRVRVRIVSVTTDPAKLGRQTSHGEPRGKASLIRISGFAPEVDLRQWLRVLERAVEGGRREPPGRHFESGQRAARTQGREAAEPISGTPSGPRFT